MGGIADSGTRITLLGRLRRDPTHQGAWREFVDLYGPKIMAWCQRWNLQEADAEDVTQVILIKLAEKLRDFTYDPSKSFRAWLKTVARHACSDFRQSKHRLDSGSGDSQVAELLREAEARDDLLRELEEEFDREIFEEAIAHVRLRVAPQTWQAFWLTTYEGNSGAEAAKRISMQVAQVYVAKRRVQRMLQEEVARLEGPVTEPN